MMGSMVKDAVNFIRSCEGGGACVEAGKMEVVAVRDSKNPDGPVLIFDMTEWRDFIWGAKNGQFDFD